MNILEQLNIAKNKPEVKITTLGDLKIGEEFEFVYNKPLKVGGYSEKRMDLSDLDAP